MTYRILSVVPSRHSRSVTSRGDGTWSENLSTSSSNEGKILAYRSSLDHRCCNAENRDDEDARRIVTIIVEGPKNEARNLKHIKGVNGL